MLSKHMQASQAHQNNFDGLRLAAALMVLVSHMFAICARPEPQLFPSISMGTMAVLIFFSISGYLVAASWQADPHLLRFMQRRLLRLWPGLAGSIALCMLVVAPLAFQGSWSALLHLPEYRHYPLNLLFLLKHPILQVFPAPNPDLNSSIWTIPLEFWCYVLLMTLGLLTPNRHFARLVAVALGLAILGFLFGLGGQHYFTTHAWVARQVFLLWFGLFFTMSATLQCWPLLQRAWPLSVAVGCLLLFLHQPILGLLLALPCLVISIGRAAWPIFKHAGRFGDYSYGFYLYAFPVQQLVTLILGRTAPIVVLLLLSLLFTTVCALLSWHLIEAPALRLKPHRPRPEDCQSPNLPV